MKLDTGVNICGRLLLVLNLTKKIRGIVLRNPSPSSRITLRKLSIRQKIFFLKNPCTVVVRLFFLKKAAFKNFGGVLLKIYFLQKFRGKRMCWIHFLIKLLAWFQNSCFCLNFAKFSRTLFYRIPLASVYCG